MDFEVFFKTNQKMIYRMIRRYVRHSDVTEELTMDVFMKIYDRWDRVSRFENPVGYLVRVAINAGKKYTLKKKILEFLPFENELVSKKAHPEDHFLLKEENEQVERLLSELKEIERNVIYMKDLDGLKFEEISIALQMKLPTVKSHYRRAKIKLAKKWEAVNDM